MILALLLAAAVVSDVSPADRLARIQKQYPELYEITQLAHGVPPEFGASALIRVAMASQLKDADWSGGLLQEAFEMAAGAQQAIPKRVAIGTVGKGAVYSTGLDTLSLQTTAVTALISSRPAVARELMERILRPAVHPATCEESLVDDPSPYYSALAQVVNQGYTPQQRAKGLHLAPAIAAVESTMAPAQVAPVARMIAALRLTPAELDAFVAKFAGALQRVGGDDRAFSWSLPEADKAVRGLAARTANGQVVLTAFRNYVARQFAGDRCQDTVRLGVLNSLAGAVGLDALERQPRKAEGTTKAAPEFTDPESQRLQREFMMLLAGNGNRGLSDEEKNTREWQDRLETLVHDIEEWRPAEARSDSEILDARRDMIGSLTWVVPSGAARERLLNEYVDLLRASGSRPDSWAAWFAGFDALLRVSRSRPAGEKGVLDAFERSGHPVLVLYAKLERVLPSPFRAPGVE